MQQLESRLLRILDLSRELVSTSDLDVLLHRIAAAAQELTATESAGILLQDQTTGELVFVTATTFADLIVNIPVPLDSSIAGVCFVSGAPLVVPDTAHDPRYYPQFEDLTGVKGHALLAVPLQYRERHIGVLEVQNKSDDLPFEANDVAILTALAAHATIAIENARLVRALQEEQERLESEVAARTIQLRAEIAEHEQDQARIIAQQRELATFEERERLGRELHDGLGQILGYVNVQTQAAEALLAQGQNAAAQANLQQIAQAARQAHTDLRSYILGLRLPQTAPSSLLSTLQNYANQFQAQYHLPVRFWLPGNLPDPLFTPAVEEQVLRVVREALTNAGKHANATYAEVTMSLVGEQVQIMIADDGCGFAADERIGEWANRQESGDSHFGLEIMRERAERVGGLLEIQSAPGRGTRVLTTVPRFLPNTENGDPGEIKGLRVLLVDDHPLFLDGLRNLLLARGMTVVATARDGHEALDKARALRPDVAVLDLNMPGCNGLQATRMIKAELPEVKVVILTISEDENDLFEAVQSGASGYLLKSLEANQFCTLLAGLLRGETAFAPGMAERILTILARSAPSATQPGDPLVERLTPRQWEILRMAADGMMYKEIGVALHLSERTIKYHMGQIVTHLQLENRAQAIKYVRGKR